MDNILESLQKVKISSEGFKNISLEKRNKIILEIWEELIKNEELIISENKKDLDKLDKSNPMYDRLLLNSQRINSIKKWCDDLIKVKNPLLKYENEEDIITNDGLNIKKIWVPLWVVACIYESRPNVTVDIAIMCIKSWNWMVLRWWSDANFSNKVLVQTIKDVLINNDIDSNLIYNFPLERENLNILYNAIWLVDVIIPRGWKSLIESVRDSSKIPIIETWAWVVHLYLDDIMNIDNINKAIDIIVNSKTSRISVCNALDTLVINKNISESTLKELFQKLVEKWVTFWILEKNIEIVESYNLNYSIINNNSFNTEQLSLKLNIIFVENIDDAIKHIQKYSSKHSDWILSDSLKNISLFKNSIDSSVVYSNTSTRFSDGSCFWFAWEVWISTQKLHVRWPMWAEALISYKYIVDSDWKIRG